MAFFSCPFWPPPAIFSGGGQLITGKTNFFSLRGGQPVFSSPGAFEPVLAPLNPLYDSQTRLQCFVPCFTLLGTFYTCRFIVALDCSSLQCDRMTMKAGNLDPETEKKEHGRNIHKIDVLRLRVHASTGQDWVPNEENANQVIVSHLYFSFRAAQ